MFTVRRLGCRVTPPLPFQTYVTSSSAIKHFIFLSLKKNGRSYLFVSFEVIICTALTKTTSFRTNDCFLQCDSIRRWESYEIIFIGLGEVIKSKLGENGSWSLGEARGGEVRARPRGSAARTKNSRQFSTSSARGRLRSLCLVCVQLIYRIV